VYLDAIGALRELAEDPETREFTIRQGLFETFLNSLPTVNGDFLEACAWLCENLSTIDAVKNELLRLDGFTKITQCFLKTTYFFQSTLVLPLRAMLNRGPLIRETVAQGCGSELIDCLQKLLEDPHRPWICIEAAGFILMLAGFFPKSKTVADAAQKVIFPNLADEDEGNSFSSLDCLMLAATAETSRPVLLSLGAKKYLAPLMQRPESQKGFTACLISALLAASDMSDTSETGSEPTFPVVIKQVVKAMNTLATTSIKWVTTVEGYMAESREILIAIRSLATNEANLKELKDAKVVSILTDLLRNRKVDLFQENFDSLEQVISFSLVFPASTFFPSFLPSFLPSFFV